MGEALPATIRILYRILTYLDLFLQILVSKQSSFTLPFHSWKNSGSTSLPPHTSSHDVSSNKYQELVPFVHLELHWPLRPALQHRQPTSCNAIVNSVERGWRLAAPLLQAFNKSTHRLLIRPPPKSNQSRATRNKLPGKQCQTMGET